MAPALAAFAACTALSMAVASTSFGYLISRRPVLRRFASVAPLLATLSLAYALVALQALTTTP